MPDATPDLLSERDLSFLLYEVLRVDELAARPRYADGGRESFDAVLATARAIALELFAPHRQAQDIDEPRLVQGEVVTIAAVKPPLAALADAGFLAATHDAALGGLQLPHVVASAAMAWFEAANVATSSYALLTTGAANLIATFGTEQQRDTWLPAMFAGRCFGTMALTEPEAGSSLADLRTTATPNDDGSYHLTGTKIWISGGDQDISPNILHLVLARMAGAPAGVRGISLFAVPKRRVAPDGTAGEANGVTLGGLIHKMGWRGTTSTLLNFGEHAPCRGELVGPPHQGLACMFQMMNEARIGVGRAATAMGYAAYRYALGYARTRRQGRHPGEKDPTRAPLRIVEHADVRRLLLAQKATVEGALALILTCERLVDDQHTAPDPAARREAELLLEVLTPVAKAWPAEACQDAISQALQVLGGYGYAREYPIEQYYRDNRLNQLHEGTNGIQALDLLGRKVRQDDGAAFRALVHRMRETARDARSAGDSLLALAGALDAGIDRVVETTEVLLAASSRIGPPLALANASVYLAMMSRTVVSWVWVQQAIAAERGLAGAVAEADRAFYRGKLHAARYYLTWELPQTSAQAELLQRLDDAPYGMQDDWF
jgi:alkylation response protein AidB-like acyl-CoA dehydrogenase